MSDYSVLLSVYYKEKAEYFDTAIKSILDQSLPPSDFVIVCDGPLTDELEIVIRKYASNKIFNIIRLPENKGLGDALKIGLPFCKHQYVLRMDSDDISLRDRAKVEIELLDQGYDVVGSYISEFYNDNPDNIAGIREVPLTQKDIEKFVLSRSPFNHPSVAFKKSSIEQTGGYMPLPYLEDWFLWVRCILYGLKMVNSSEVLVNMRSGYLMRARRGGKKYRKSIRWLFKYMYNKKLIGPVRRFINVTKYILYSVLPLKIKAILTDKFLRRKKKNV